MMALRFSLVLIVLILAQPALASSDQESGFAHMIAHVEASVERDFDAKAQAEMVAKVNAIDDIAKQNNESLSLFVVGNWLQNQLYDPALQLIEKTRVPAKLQDLKKFYLASILMEKGDLDQARPLVVDLAKKHPKDPDTVFLRSSFLAHSQDYMAAIQVLGENLEDDRMKGRTYLQRGLLHILVYNYDEAIKDLRRSLRSLEKDQIASRQMAYYQIGLLHFHNTQNLKKAKKYFKKGKVLDPHSRLTRELQQKVGAF